MQFLIKTGNGYMKLPKTKSKFLCNNAIELPFSFISKNGKTREKSIYIGYKIPAHEFDINLYNGYQNYCIDYTIYINNPKDIAFILLQVAKYVRLDNIDYELKSSNVNNAKFKRSMRNKCALSIMDGPIINNCGHKSVTRKLIDLSETNFHVIEILENNSRLIIISLN